MQKTPFFDPKKTAILRKIGDIFWTVGASGPGPDGTFVDRPWVRWIGAF